MTSRQGATLESGLLLSLDQGAAPVGVAVVARVVAYDPAAGTADVLPMVQPRRVVEGAPEPVPVSVLYGCPIVWPSAGGRSLTWGLAVGDLCLCIIRDRSHDEIDSGSAGPLMPAASRRFSPSDAVVLPGYDVPGTLPASAVRSDGQMVARLPAGEALHVGVAMAARALALAEETRLQFEAHRDKFNGHKHGASGISDSMGGSCTGATSGPDTSIDATPDLGSSRIKVDA